MRWLSLLLTTLLASVALVESATAEPLTAVTLQPGPGTTRIASAPPTATAVPGRVVVVFDDDAGPSDRQDTRADAGTTVVRSLGAKAYQLLRPAPGRTVANAIAALRTDPDVRTVERDLLLQPAAIPNDPLFDQQWGLRNLGLGVNGSPALGGADIDVQSAWDHTVGTPSTIVADIDSGYRDDNPDLASVQVPGWDFIGNDSDPTDDDLVGGGHGVHTAGIIGAAGNNGIGVTGVAQNVRIMPLRVCSHAQSCPTSAIANAINYAGQHGARVTNLSLGGSQSTAINNAITDNPQVLFVIAAGNGNPDTGLGVDNDGGSPYRSYPCINTPVPGALDNVLCVAATSQSDQLASFSNWGRTTVDLGAPGTDILSTYPTFATPLFSDDFASNDFGTRWTTTTPGFSRTSEAPLTSFGLANSPAGSDQPAGTTRSAASVTVTVPATSTCTLSLDVKAVMKDGHSFAFGPMQGSSFVDPGPPLEGPISGSGRVEWDFDVPSGATRIGLEYAITSGSDPSDPGAGIHVDNVVFNCIAPVGQTTGTGFLDGTSMATPMVTGAAALLFSQLPSATVTQVRNAIVQNTDPLSALATTTVSGGRLDVGKAMAALIGQPVSPTPPATPPATAPTATITAPFATPLPIVKVVRCVVPKLSGRTLAGATAALKRARCRVGRVTKPRHRSTPLRVKSTNPRAGTRRASGTRVALVLATKKRKR